MVVRAFAPVRHNDDLHLRAAVNFLRAHLDEKPLAERHDHLTEAVRLFDAAATDQRLSSLKHMRHKMLAHWAKPQNVPLPRYDDLFEFTRATAKIWEELSFGAGTVMVPINHQVDAYRESAEALWGIWETLSSSTGS